MRERRSPRARRRRRLGLASGCAAVLCLATLPGASADGASDDETFPSRERVRQAQERATTTAEKVDAIEAQLVAADERLAALSLEAAKAAEAYNGARYELRQARIAARRAERTADRAAADVREREELLSDGVVANFQNGGPLTSFGVLMQDPDPDALLERLDAYAGVTGALRSDLDNYESAKVVADVLEDRAEAAVSKQREATAEAEAAKQAVDATVADAEAAVSTIAAEKAALVRRLARVQDISVELAQERQRALAEQAEEAAAEAAAEAAEQAEQQQQQAEQPAEPQDPGGQESEPSDSDNDPPADEDNDPPPSEEDDDPPPTDSDPGPSHGARAAIAYAKAQLGEPYVYAAAGPDSWDCSGLTMQAWAAAGESLSHWSVAQYYQTTPISFSDIRRGDLLFWGDSDDPDTIYHVAMYLGNDMMIHAPRPGRSVEIVSLYYWILPNFYTRV